MILGTFEQHIEEMCRQRSMTLEEAGAFLRRLGVQAVCAGAHELPDPLESRKRLEGVGLFFSDVYGTLPFISQQADEAAIRALLQKTAALGAKRLLVTSEPYRDMDDAVKREEDLLRTIDGLKRTVGLASACGVEIELEDFDCAATPFSFTDDLLRVFQEVPGIRFAFDSGNFVLAGEDEIAALEKLKQYVGPCVHLKDRSLTPYLGNGAEEAPLINLKGKRYYPCPVGKGIIRFDRIAELLRELAFDGTLVMEHFGAADQYRYVAESAACVGGLFGIKGVPAQ